MFKKYKITIIALVITLLPLVALGQGGINSPYSMLGIGDLTGKGFGRNIAMGNVMSSLISPVQLNTENPASYSQISQNTFIFEFGVNAKFYQLKNNTDNFSNVTGNISYIAAGFPITKWLKTGVGLKPISNVGYQIKEVEKINSELSINNSYDGKGGINTLYMDNSVSITKNISLGVKLSYIFGTLNKDTKRVTNNAKSSKSASIIYEYNHSAFDAIGLGFGAHWNKIINPKLTVNLGATYNLKTELEGLHDRFVVSAIKKVNKISVGDTIMNQNVNRGVLDLPMSYSVGASVILNQQWEFAADYNVEDWTKSKMFGKEQDFNKNEQYCFGVEFAPDINSTKYYKIIKYRAGFSLNNSYLMVQDKRLKEIIASIGFALPLKRFAIINLSGSYSRRYVPGLDILKEDIFQIHLNFSFKGTWFIKSKFY